MQATVIHFINWQFFSLVSLEDDFEKKEKQTNKQKTDTKTKQNNSYFSF